MHQNAECIQTQDAQRFSQMSAKYHLKLYNIASNLQCPSFITKSVFQLLFIVGKNKTHRTALENYISGSLAVYGLYFTYKYRKLHQKLRMENALDSNVLVVQVTVLTKS